jgi:hypothetical protein
MRLTQLKGCCAAGALFLAACGAQTPRQTPTPAFDSSQPAVVASVSTIRPTGTVEGRNAPTEAAAVVAQNDALNSPIAPADAPQVTIAATDGATVTATETKTDVPPTQTPQPPPTPMTAAESSSAAALASPLATPTDGAMGASTTASATVTATASLPIVQNGQKRILFINGDHIPENGYPHSRLADDGSKPESFSKLRKQVLEGQLQLGVDEFVLGASNSISATQLTSYTAVVLGSNGRVLTPDEVATLTRYANDGGRILLYADFQYGPTNWSSDNAFLNQFGIEVFPDNFQPTTQITDIVQTHPIMAGVTSFGTEGSSQFLVSASAVASTTILSKCSPLERSGCAVQAPEQAKIKPGDVVACTWVRVLPAGPSGKTGRIAGTCDRNTFHNGPGVGTALNEFSNERYAVGLFKWLVE